MSAKLPSKLPKRLQGDGPCSNCGTRENIVWFTDNVFWNEVIRRRSSVWRNYEPILCINCFVNEVDQVGLEPTGWRLVPEFPWREKGAKP